MSFFWDGLRGLAARWILLGHCSVWSGHQLLSVPNLKTVKNSGRFIHGVIRFF